jgi:hypothetical protein
MFPAGAQAWTATRAANLVTDGYDGYSGATCSFSVLSVDPPCSSVRGPGAEEVAAALRR